MTEFTSQEVNLFSHSIENLLYQNEGTSLDFKVKQYPFNSATDEEKSELLKDVIAFANSWRMGDAYILIGVRAVVGGRHIPVGTEEHFDDAQLQQFINSKTNRKVVLSYEVHLIEGNKIGVIRIPKQERPIYAIKRFGKVEKETVYFRLGSSTTIAKPEDIARMGRDSIGSPPTPVLSLKFADHQNRTELGTSIELKSIAYEQVSEYLPDAGENSNPLLQIYDPTRQINKNYWREKEEYIRLTNLLSPVSLMIRNQSSNLAENVRVEIVGSTTSNITIIDEDNLPEKPAYNLFLKNYNFRPFWKKQQTTVEHHGNRWTLTINFGNVQAQSCVWAAEPFYIGSTSQTELQLDSSIYADNLPKPQKTSLNIQFNIRKKPALTVNDLEQIED